MPFLHWLLLFVGVLAILGTALDWDWYMENSRVQFVSRLFKLSRNAARLLYFLVGIALVGYVVWMAVI